MIPSWTFSFHLYLPPRSLDYFTANTRHFSFMLSRHSAVLCLVAQLYPTLCSPTNCSQPGTSVHGDSPGKNTGVGCHALLYGIFLTQGSNPGLPHCRQILYCLSHQGGPRILEWVAYPFPRGSSQSKNCTGSPALQVDSLLAELLGKPWSPYMFY